MDGGFLEKLTSAESLPVLVAGIALGGLTVGLLLKRYLIFGSSLNITLVIEQQFSPVLCRSMKCKIRDNARELQRIAQIFSFSAACLICKRVACIVTHRATIAGMSLSLLSVRDLPATLARFWFRLCLLLATSVKLPALRTMRLVPRFNILLAKGLHHPSAALLSGRDAHARYALCTCLGGEPKKLMCPKMSRML